MKTITKGLSAFCITIILMAAWTLTAAKLSSPIYLSLCMDLAKEGLDKEFIDALELELLLSHNVHTSSCAEKKDQENHYRFRHQVLDAMMKDGRNRRATIKSALYDHTGRAIFSRIEFMNKSSRAKILAQVPLLATSIIKAVWQNETTVDPFAMAQIESSQESTFLAQGAPQYKEQNGLSRFESRDENRRKVELFIGTGRSSQFAYQKFFADINNEIVSKAFLIYGVDVSFFMANNFGLGGTVKMAYVPLELLRPSLRVLNHDLRQLLIDASCRLQWQFVERSQYVVTSGLSLEFLYTNSSLDQLAPNAALKTYWQSRQGAFMKTRFYFDLFATYLTIEAAFFPFSQNYALKAFTPLINFSWHAGIAVESILHRLFSLKFSLVHDADFYRLSHSLPQTRVVSMRNLTYLGLVLRW